MIGGAQRAFDRVVISDGNHIEAGSARGMIDQL
jgi:hypothetical protein